MPRLILTGNEAVARGALCAGVKVATGYPGTPSTGCLAHLLSLDLPGRHVEWSANEKVALEIAAGAAWAGQRALVTMKMTGVNVAYDALISFAYSGTNGGLVIYVADDPGVSAGMAEQDTRGFAEMSGLAVLEPATPADAYRLVREAFELSEAVGAPVFLRSTTAVALTHAPVSIDDTDKPSPDRPLVLEKDIARYTKAGSAICITQHQALLRRLDAAGRWIADRGLNVLRLSKTDTRVGLIVGGAVRACLDEALDAARIERDSVSVLELAASLPFPDELAVRLLAACDTVIVAEELEPYVERALYVLAQRTGWNGRIAGTLDGTFERTREIGVPEIVRGLSSAVRSDSSGLAGRSPEVISPNGERPEAVLSSTGRPIPRPITVCAGCPHRGTYLAIERAIRDAGLSKDEVVVTGDIGCTILGMNPPFDLLWTEVSMGSSVSLAQGYAHAGVKTPVIATIGDSTFFHGGIPGLINAIQHRTPLTLVVMDNGWTSMTGMQVNPGTADAYQNEGRRVDLEAVLRGLGPDVLEIVDPYDLEATSAAVLRGLQRSMDRRSDADSAAGVSVILAQRECAIQARRRGVAERRVVVDPEACILCRRCVQVTGCPALGLSFAETGDGSPGRQVIAVDPALCNGCGLCVSFCPPQALGWADTRGGDR